MPPESLQYTLVGFSVELDWRPLRFMKPIPDHRVCCTCGLVRKRTALLSCMHTLCESCYEQCAQDGTRVCPLDGRQCEDDDVDLRDIDVDDLLRREVKCWNEGSDCRAVLPAYKIAQHFQQECRHHTISCPKCFATVPCSSVCAHLQSECDSTPTPFASGCEEDSSRRDETVLLSSFMQSLGAQAGELKALMEQVLAASGANSDRLNEIGHGVNNCQEALREELRQGMSGVKDAVRQEVARRATEQRHCLKKCSDEIAVLSEETKEHFIASSNTIGIISSSIHALEKLLRDELAKVAKERREQGSHVVRGSEEPRKQVKETNNAMGHMSRILARPPDLPESVCEFSVKGIKSLEEEVRKVGWAAYDSGMVHLRGYCLFPGVWFAKSRRFIKLSARFHLHMGGVENDVPWPFRQRIRLLVMHSKGGAERELVVHPFNLSLSPQRQQNGEVQYALLSEDYLSLEDLIRDGYVHEDQLRVKFELLP